MTDREYLRQIVRLEEWPDGVSLYEIASRGLDCSSSRCVLLFAAACCRRVWDLLEDARSRRAVVAGEKYADGLISIDDLREAEQAAFDFAEGLMERMPDLRWKASATFFAAWAASSWTGVSSGRRPISGSAHNSEWATAWHSVPRPEDRDQREAVRKSEGLRQLHLLADIFGNPFRPVAFDPVWRTANVTAIAATIYAERRFADLPVLADALEEAGCTSADLLNHCRQPGEHVRGCWAVDLALGKE